MFTRIKVRLHDMLLPRTANLTVQSKDPNSGSHDALAAIEELSRAVHNDPDAVEIYLALGNLYRLRGDIDRAVHIRRSLIVRSGLDSHFRARAYLELGRDYRRSGFVDRAQQAFEEATKLGADREAIIFELASLYADSGAFEQAAEQFKRLGHHIAVAHYLTRYAEERCSAGYNDEARKILKRALKAYPGSIEAWTRRILLNVLEQDWNKARSHLREAMKHITPDKRFLVFDGILALSYQKDIAQEAEYHKEDALAFEQARCECVLPIIEEQEPELLLHYYGALFLLQCGNTEEASNWLAKTMVLQPEFWAGRLEMLSLALPQQQLSPVFQGQVEYFVQQARRVKRFVCQQCGLHREQTFYVCPRCHSWHSASFRIFL